MFLYGFNEDNIGYVIREPQTNALIAVDVGDTEQSGKVIRGLEKEFNTTLSYILTTHRHWDHVNGNLYWLEQRPDLKILGSKKQWQDIPGLKKENAMNDL